MVRRRKTEVDLVLRDVDGPIFRKIVEVIHDIEQGKRTCAVANLDELAAYAAELRDERGRPK